MNASMNAIRFAQTDSPARRLAAVLERLVVHDAVAARRAERAIACALAGVQRSVWPQVAWRSSRLTGTGYPLEFAWSSRDAAIRWTAEVAGPERPLSERLPAVLDRLRELTNAPVSLSQEWLDLSGRAQRFGAWLGGRHDGDADRFKIYVETPPGEGSSQIERFLGSVAADVPTRILWRMAGIDAHAGRTEFYGRVQRLERWEMTRLFEGCGFDPGPLYALTEAVVPYAPSESFLPGSSGLSLTVGNDGKVVSLGWFGFVRFLLGDDERTACVLRTIMERHDWPLDLYDALLGPTPSGAFRHGFVGLGTAANGEVWMQLGLQP